MRLLNIDLFAGGGGASTGIEAALGRPVDYAINHSPAAIECHRQNHPETIHLCESIYKVRPLDVTQGRPVRLLWASPDCTHHSKAKGGRPISRGRRGLAGAVLWWLDQVRPEALILENVEEFQDWAPLADGRPDPERKGESFRRWIGRIRGLGYSVEWRELVAADFGAATTRRRLFVIARRDGQAITWPEPTHARLPGGDMFAGVKHWRRALDCIDFRLPMRPIERTPPLAAATLARIERGRKLNDMMSGFLISYYSNGGAHSLLDSLPTITTRDRFALICGDQIRMLTPRELAKAQGFPDSYILPTNRSVAVALIGNSVAPPVAEAVVRANLDGTAAEVAA